MWLSLLSITVVIKVVLVLLGVTIMFIWVYVFKFLLFFGDPNITCLQKQDWQRELNFLKPINLKSFQ